jgi:ubiquinone biosynthesis protein
LPPGSNASFDLGRIVGAVNLVKEFERTIFRELDMLIEAGNIERFHPQLRGGRGDLYPHGVLGFHGQIGAGDGAYRGDQDGSVDEIRRHGIDPEEVAMIGLRSFSRQLMAAGIFHADPHPGNTLVMHDGRVSLVDFGIVGYLDEETMMQIAHLFLGFAEHDYDMVMEAFEAAGLVDPGPWT